MSTMTLNPGCRHRCHFDRTRVEGFVIDPACAVHTRPGYTPFVVSYLNGRPWCLGRLVLVDAGTEQATDQLLILGLN